MGPQERVACHAPYAQKSLAYTANASSLQTLCLEALTRPLPRGLLAGATGEIKRMKSAPAA